MTTRRAFRIGGWVALVAGALAAAAAATTAVIGILALTGKATYPAEYDVGPFSIESTISTPVALYGEVCQSADISAQDTSRECFSSFLDEGVTSNGGQVYHQNPDVRPTHATLRGEVELVTTGGWSPLVAGIVTRGVLGLTVLSAIILMLWRLLAAASTGEAFSKRTVRYLRGIGGLVIASAVLAPALNHTTSPGDDWTSIGPQPHLWGASPGVYPDDVNLAQLALGGLILLVAEIFRHGATIEAERRLTV